MIAIMFDTINGNAYTLLENDDEDKRKMQNTISYAKRLFDLTSFQYKRSKQIKLVVFRIFYYLTTK